MEHLISQRYKRYKLEKNEKKSKRRKNIKHLAQVYKIEFTIIEVIPILSWLFKIDLPE